MKKRALIPALMVLSMILVSGPSAHAQFKDLLKGARKILGGSGLSEDKIIAGLKEALQIGTSNAVEKVSQLDGYYGNPKIRIPLPDAVKKFEKALRLAGYGDRVDAFEMSMNRAAERAAPEAKSIFLDAIKQMTISDARKILNGRKNEATLYFKEKTRDRLQEIFKPVVHGAMSEVGVTRSYQDLDSKIRDFPMGDRLSFDLDDYVTGRGLDGLFLMLAREEKKIRTNPAARVTELLKEVFGTVAGGK